MYSRAQLIDISRGGVIQHFLKINRKAVHTMQFPFALNLLSQINFYEHIG